MNPIRIKRGGLVAVPRTETRRRITMYRLGRIHSIRDDGAIIVDVPGWADWQPLETIGEDGKRVARLCYGDDVRPLADSPDALKDLRAALYFGAHRCPLLQTERQ